MKWLIQSIISAAILFFLCTPANAQIIYGLESAQAFKGHAEGSYYIHAGGFLDPSRAMRFKNHLQSKTKYPVMIEQQNKFNLVVIGPIENASEIREVANSLLSKPNIKAHTEEEPTEPETEDETETQDDEPVKQTEPYTEESTMPKD